MKLLSFWNRVLSFITEMYWREHLAYCGKDTTIGHGTVFSNPSMMFVGDHCRIGSNVYITGREVRISDWVTISNDSKILASGLDIEKGERHYLSTDVYLSKGAWIASNCLILGGVKIGEGAVVGAGSVITKDVEPYVFVAGNPAKKIKMLTKGVNYGKEKTDL